MKIRNVILATIAALSLLGGASAYGQTSTGKVTTAAPTYTNNTAAPLSLDTAGNLRVVNGGSPAGTQDVNIIAVGGNAVTTTVPVSGTVTANDRFGTAFNPIDAMPNTLAAVGVVDSAGVSRNAIQTLPFLWNGTTWDRAPGSASLGLSVNCLSGCVAGSGVSQGAATTAAPTYITGTNNPLSLDLAGNLRVLVGNASIPVTGTIAATQSGTWNIGTVTAVTGITNPVAVTGTFWQATQPVSGTFWQATQPVSGTVASTQSGTWNTGQMPLAATGTTNYSLIAANTTNSTSVVAGAHSLLEVSVYNNSATIAYLKLYDSGSAPTCGSGTPVARYLIPGASSGGAGSNIPLPFGKAFVSGIAFCITTGIADADTAAPAASAYLVNLTYK